MAAYTAIDDPSAYFKVQLYTGNGGTQSITFNDTDTTMQPDITWIKCRTGAEDHALADSVRGDSGAASGYYTLQTNDNNAQSSGSWNTLVDAITSDGFNLGNNDQVNSSSQPFVSWSWKAGTTTGITTNGSTTITPTAYSFNATSKCSILKYSGNGVAGAKVAHGLGVTPTCMIIKRMDATAHWTVYHQSLGNEYKLYLNNDYAKTDDAAAWNDTSPDTVNFTLGTENAVNNSGGTYVAYCFADRQGYFKTGDYVGNGNVNGYFAYCGFKPSLVIIKMATDAGYSWTMRGNKMNPYNVAENNFACDTNAAMAASKDIDLVSNGWKGRTTDGGIMGDTKTFVWVAWGQSIVGDNGVTGTAY